MICEKCPMILGTKIYERLGWYIRLVDVSDNYKNCSFNGNEKSTEGYFFKQSWNLNMISVTWAQPLMLALKLDFYTSFLFFYFLIGELLSQSFLHIIQFDDRLIICTCHLNIVTEIWYG